MSMTTVRTIPELRDLLRVPRGEGGTIGLVPTMGALHEGHISLLRRARADNDVVVMSLFVNPSQFGVNEDLTGYPRNEHRDTALAESAGVDILFAPAVDEVYPDGFATTVHVAGITDVMCGAHRGPGHFDGVATVVTKLLHIVEPHAAYFGQKDAQQVLVIRRLVRDLDLPVEIVACPTVREPDGLAMSSRNAYLDPVARRQATGLHRALDAAQEAVNNGCRAADEVLAAARAVLADAGIEPEYLDLRSPDDLTVVNVVGDTALLAVAARVGSARLIDNRILEVPN